MRMMRCFLIVFFFTQTLYSSICRGVVYYDDPIAVGIGARPLGMGKAFVAVADDVNAMFLNPAGLGSQKTGWTVSTMTSNFLDEYQYTMYSGVMPTPAGVFGVGYVSSRIAGVAVSFEGTSGMTDFYNQALVLSYGKDISETLSLTESDAKIYAGATLKYYSKGFTGDINATGTGYNIDLGLKYVPVKWMSYGLNLQNVVNGSRISGFEPPEVMPSIAKIGLAFHWLEYDVKFAIDSDMFLSGPNIPWPTHVGAEWRAHPNLSLRAGYDQEGSGASGGLLTNNTTFGLGLDYAGIKADLAFMQNYEQSSFASNIFSLTFCSGADYVQEAQPPKQEAQPPKKEEVSTPTAEAVAKAAAPEKTVAQKISIIPAEDLQTLYREQEFTGSVDRDVTDVWIDGRKLEIWSDRAFVETVPLNIGMNKKVIKIRDASSVEAVIIKKIFRFYVPGRLSLEEALNKPFEYKVIYTELRSYLGKDFNIGKDLSREMLAIIISKARRLDLSLPQKDVFKDVSRNYWAARFINAVQSAGIMRGYADGTFKPNNIATKAEAALIMSATATMDKTWLKEYLASKRSKEKATMDDFVEIAYHSGMFREAINSYNDFLGIKIPPK
jgi:hypothetical protein